MLVKMLDVLSGCERCILESPAHGPCCSVGKAWKRMVTKVCFVGEGFTRKPPKYERFIRPMVGGASLCPVEAGVCTRLR